MKLVKNALESVSKVQRHSKLFVRTLTKRKVLRVMKKLIIKFLKLNDISSMLIKAKTQQKKLDEKYWSEKLRDSDERMKRERDLDSQEFTAQITMLQDQVSDYKKRERELEIREHSVRQQAKENSFLATKMNLKVGDLAKAIIKISEEMVGLKTESEKHSYKIENK